MEVDQIIFKFLINVTLGSFLTLDLDVIVLEVLIASIWKASPPCRATSIASISSIVTSVILWSICAATSRTSRVWRAYQRPFATPSALSSGQLKTRHIWDFCDLWGSSMIINYLLYYLLLSTICRGLRLSLNSDFEGLPWGYRTYVSKAAGLSTVAATATKVSTNLLASKRWKWGYHTLDGRNPAPVDMENLPLFKGFYLSQVVQDFFHQQYHVIWCLWWSGHVSCYGSYCVAAC